MTMMMFVLKLSDTITEVPDDRIILGDIRNIVDHLEEYVNDEIDVVIGGPPCQGFSTANQQRIIDDPRNELYKYFPKLFLKLRQSLW